jgi:predicted aspartyl protease
MFTLLIGFLPIRTVAENPSGSIAYLDLLIGQKRYLELESAFAVSESDLTPVLRAYFKGVIANRTNQGSISIQLLQPILPMLIATESVRAEIALCTVADDYAKVFRYGDAAAAYAEGARVSQRQGRQSACNARQQSSRWDLLAYAHPQTISGRPEFEVAGKRDTFGLFEVPVAAGHYSGSWIVDSGANLSVIRRSVAEKMGLKISAKAETAQGVGPSVTTRVSIIPELRLGKAVVHNVPVLVVEDSTLTFSRVDYQIDGCLGFPVMAAFGAITFYSDGRIGFGTTPVTNVTGFHNLFLEKFTPLIAADFGLGDRLFTLDTGAQGTVLSAQFYLENRHSSELTNLVDLELVGAGGTVSSPAYVLPTVVARFGDKCATIKQVPLLMASTSSSYEFYGNLGQSALASFSSFTLDFATMHFNVSGDEHNICQNV